MAINKRLRMNSITVNPSTRVERQSYRGVDSCTSKVWSRLLKGWGNETEWDSGLSLGNFFACVVLPHSNLARISDPNPAIQKIWLRSQRWNGCVPESRRVHFFPKLSFIGAFRRNKPRRSEEFRQMVLSHDGMSRKKLGEFIISVNNRETKRKITPTVSKSQDCKPFIWWSQVRLSA